MVFSGYRQKEYSCLLVYCCLAVILLAAGPGPPEAAAEQNVLQKNDCAKCHPYKVQILTEAGGKHATEIGCLDCHPQHPPKGENTISPCTLCHVGQPHFEITDCLHCHVDPHRPLASLRDPVKPARDECLSCHEEPGLQMSASPSRHADLFCTYCHESHRMIPACLDCHGPHLSGQSEADCLRCHQAHQPLHIVPVGYLPESFCRVCHKRQAQDLAETRTYHGTVNCSYCHKGLHPSVPSCLDCHDRPHAGEAYRKYSPCLDCHGDAHRLVVPREK